jgi:hypothetical protein
LLGLKHVRMHYKIPELREQEKKEGLKEGELIEKMARSWNIHNLKEMASTQLLMVNALVRYYWTGNPKPPMYKEDGSRDHEVVVTDPLPSDCPRKFLIYVAYRYHRNLLGRVSDAWLAG